MNVQVEREEVFDGHFEECLDHLANRLTESAPKGSREITRLKEPIAEFCGVTVDTVTDWLFRRSYRPKGQKLIKLMCYLVLIGYRVREFQKMKPAVRGFNELVGYDVISVDEATKILDYPASSSLYRVLAGKYKATASREKKMLDSWIARRAELEEKKEATAEHYMAKELESAGGVLSSIQKAVLLQMEALLSLLEWGGQLELDIFGRADTETVYKLSTRLSDLSSQLYSKEEEAHER